MVGLFLVLQYQMYSGKQKAISIGTLPMKLTFWPFFNKIKRLLPNQIADFRRVAYALCYLKCVLFYDLMNLACYHIHGLKIKLLLVRAEMATLIL